MLILEAAPDDACFSFSFVFFFFSEEACRSTSTHPAPYFVAKSVIIFSVWNKAILELVAMAVERSRFWEMIQCHRLSSSILWSAEAG
jgi:hypothetical protein